MEKEPPATATQDWYQLNIDQALTKRAGSQEGLSMDEAQKRSEEYGPNELKEAKRITPLAIFFNQFKDFMILVLMVAAVISGFLGDIIDTIAIVAIVIINAIIGFIQEYKAEKAMQALKKMSTSMAKVLRSNQVRQIPSAEIVPGDLVLVEAGDIIPADLRLLKSDQLKVNEASLTGESVAV
jgi:Ca2+-transporting ATPase